MISPKSSSAHYCSRRIREEGEEEGERKKKGPSSYLIRRWEEGRGGGGKGDRIPSSSFFSVELSPQEKRERAGHWRSGDLLSSSSLSSAFSVHRPSYYLSPRPREEEEIPQAALF